MFSNLDCFYVIAFDAHRHGSLNYIHGNDQSAVPIAGDEQAFDTIQRTSANADALANLSQVSLSAKTIARRHGVSDRYIRLLFEETGQTFGEFVLEERLKWAFQLLNGSVRPDMRISDVASEVGFSDVTTFNRAFKRRFGDTPRTIRHRKPVS